MSKRATKHVTTLSQHMPLITVQRHGACDVVVRQKMVRADAEKNVSSLFPKKGKKTQEKINRLLERIPKQ